MLKRGLYGLFCYTQAMNTTFILAGGNDRTTEGYGQRLAHEITKYIARPKILSCFYSWPASTWEAKAVDWKGWFSQYFGEDIAFDYAKTETFLSQIDWADVIYLHGGDTQMLFDTLPATDSLIMHFKGKIVVGSSAGANVLSKNYWSSKRALPNHGLGFADVNVMVHYGALMMGERSRTAEDWLHEEAAFQRKVGNEDVKRLPEGQFVVLRA